MKTRGKGSETRGAVGGVERREDINAARGQVNLKRSPIGLCERGNSDAGCLAALNHREPLIQLHHASRRGGKSSALCDLLVEMRTAQRRWISSDSDKWTKMLPVLDP